MTITVRTLEGVLVISGKSFDELPLENIPDGSYWLVREDRNPPIRLTMNKQGDDYYLGCDHTTARNMIERPKKEN